MFEALLLSSSNKSSPLAGLIGVINICLNSLMIEDNVCRPGLPTSYNTRTPNSHNKKQNSHNYQKLDFYGNVLIIS